MMDRQTPDDGRPRVIASRGKNADFTRRKIFYLFVKYSLLTAMYSGRQ